MTDFDESAEDRLVNEAEELMRQGRFEDAVGRYEDLCKLSPSDAMARLGYASALECAGDLSAAERVVSETATKHRMNLNVHRFQHLFFERREDYSRALLCQEVLREHAGLKEGPLDQLADLYFNQGRYHEALKELERIQNEEQIEDEMLLASVLGRIGACHRQAGKHDTAIDFLESALEHEPDNHWLLTELAETERAEENDDAARSAYNRALEVMPNDHFARSRLAQLEFEEGNVEEAVTLYQQILEELPKAHWAMVELAQMLTHSDSKRSRQLCKDALDIDPTFPSAYSQLGQLARLENNLEEARKHYLEALHTMPNANWILHELADITHNLGRKDEAQTHLDRARSNDPFDPISYGVQADFLRHEQMLPEAIAYLRKAVELDAEYTWAWRELAEVQALSGNEEAADEAFEQYDNLEENIAYSDGLRAFILRTRNQQDASIPYLERAVIEQPDYYWAWRELVEHYLSQEQYAQAEEKAKAAIKNVGSNPALWGMLAESLRQQKKYDEAIPAIEQAIELNENIPQLWALRAELFIHTDSPEAINSAQRAATLDTAHEYQVLHAQCLLHAGKIEAAQRLIIDVIEQDCHDAYLYDMATDIAMRQGEHNAAQLWADRGLAHHPQHKRLLLRRATLAIELKEAQAADLLQAAVQAPGQQAWREFILPFAQLNNIAQSRRYAYLAVEQHRDQNAECARIWMTLAEAELLQKHAPEAQIALDECIACDPHFYPAHLLIGMLAEQEHRYDSAELHLRTVYEACIDLDNNIDIDKRLLLRQLAHIEEQRHQADSARLYLDLLGEASNNDIASQIDRAAYELRQGDRALASSKLLHIIDDELCTDHLRNRVIHNLAWHYLQSDSASSAHTWLKKHLPHLDIHGLLLAAQLALAHGAFTEAQDHIQLIPEKSLNKQHQRILCRAYIGQQQYAKAEQVVRALCNEDPSDEESAVLLGESLSYQHKYEAALEQLRHPQLPLVASDERLFLVACILLELNDVEHCLSWLGHKPAKMVAEIPLKRVFQSAFASAWCNRDVPLAGDNDLLALPPFPLMMLSLATCMVRQHHEALASQLLVLAHSVSAEQHKPSVARSIATENASLFKRLGKHRLARRFALLSGKPLLILRCILPF